MTIFKGEQGIPRDDEAEKHWLAVGVPKERIFDMGMKDNFWPWAIPALAARAVRSISTWALPRPTKATLTACSPATAGATWKSGTWSSCSLIATIRARSIRCPGLPSTPAWGWSAVASVLQGKISNYDTDLFMPLLAAAAKLTGVDLEKELAAEKSSRSAASLRVVADHARAVTFLISDGILPANEGRGYVLRKILRRGIRHGRLLGATKPFMHEMVMAVRDLMKDAYPELVEAG